MTSGVTDIPRDPSGNFSLVPGTIVATGDTIEVSQHNPPFLDVAQALTGSLARNGTGGMQAALNMNSFGITSLADGVNPTDAVTKRQLDAVVVGVPLGVPVDFWGDTPPDGYAFCYGQAISRTTYADLFAVIGTNAGAGDGSTTFNLPDYRCVVSAGKSNMGGSERGLLSNFPASDDINGLIGSQSHTLTTGEMPSHGHGVSDPGHIHDFPQFILTGGSAVNNGSGLTETGTRQTALAMTGISIQATGGNGAHNNVQPTIVCNKIMRVQ